MLMKSTLRDHFLSRVIRALNPDIDKIIAAWKLYQKFSRAIYATSFLPSATKRRYFGTIAVNL